MKYTCQKIKEIQRLVFFFIFILFACLISPSKSQNVRFTVSGSACVFPMNYAGQIHNNCILNEQGQEWCYIDNMGISWEFCARGNFNIQKSILIKNIDLNDKTQFCFFNNYMDKKIYATKCETLLLLKNLKNKHGSDLSTEDFEFFWMNGAQIKTKDGHRCLHPVETPIINKNKISYYGFLESQKCIINDDLTIKDEQKWKIDENGRIINEYLKKCLVRSKDQKKLSLVTGVIKNKLDFDISEVFLGDCIGSMKGYSGREIFLLEEFHPEKLELLALDKLMKVYNDGRKTIDNIFNKSNSQLLKVMSYNSMLIDHKKLLDETETKLDEAGKHLEIFDIEKKFKIDNSKFDYTGLIFSGFSDKEKVQENSSEFRFFINQPKITDSKIQTKNFLDVFNKNQNSMEYDYSIPLELKVLKFSGFYISNNIIKSSENLFLEKIIVETNTNFHLIINSKIILESSTNINFQESKNQKKYTSENLRVLSNSLNELQIIIENIPNLNFSIHHIFNNEKIEFQDSDFIPVFDKQFCMTKKDFLNKLEVLNCNSTFNNINIKENKFLFCDEQCRDETESDSTKKVCKTAFDKGLIPYKGGLVNLIVKNQQLQIDSFDFPHLVLDEGITELKLGYIEDLLKMTKESSEKKFKNYILNFNNKDTNPEHSFLFYKKGFIHDFQKEILINVKLLCDNSNRYNGNSKFSSDSKNDYDDGLNKFFKKKIKKEKIHDMINGFTIILYKITYGDYLHSLQDIPNKSLGLQNIILPLVDDIRLDIVENTSHTWITPGYNQYVCNINKKSVLLRVKTRKINDENKNESNGKYDENYVRNIPDYHADTKTSDQDVLKYFDTTQNTKFLLKCYVSEKPGAVDKNSICMNAVQSGLIARTGGVVKVILENGILKMESVSDLPCVNIFSSNNYRVFNISQELSASVEAFLNTIFNKRLSSFLETGVNLSTSTGSKFYSHDVLAKIEQGLDRVTDRIIEGSKKISEVNKINEDLVRKLEKIQKGDNSIEVLNGRVNQITKLETNFEERVNKKFHKYQKIIQDKDEKIKELKSKNFNFKHKNFYNFKTHSETFYDDWLITDSLVSKNGPSDWNVKFKEPDEYFLVQNSAIFVNNQIIESKIESASTVVFKNNPNISNLYSKFSFISKTYGSLNINFRYKDYQNFVGLKLQRNSSDSGIIELVEMEKGKTTIISQLTCDKMLNIFKKCFGYNTFEDNNINEVEIFHLEEELKLVIKINEKIVFKLKNIKFYNNFSFSINNQIGLVIQEIVVREMSIQEIMSFIYPNKNKTDTEPIRLKEENFDYNKAPFKKNKLLEKLKYNQITNSFQHDEESQPIPDYRQKRHEIKAKCLHFEKEDYICNYLSNVFTKNSVNLASSSVEELNKLIATNCLETMKNQNVCDQILSKLNPVIKVLIKDYCQVERRVKSNSNKSSY